MLFCLRSWQQQSRCRIRCTKRQNWWNDLLSVAIPMSRTHLYQSGGGGYLTVEMFLPLLLLYFQRKTGT